MIKIIDMNMFNAYIIVLYFTHISENKLGWDNISNVTQISKDYIFKKS